MHKPWPDIDFSFEKCQIKYNCVRDMTNCFAAEPEKHWVVYVCSYTPSVFNEHFFQMSKEFGEYKGTMWQVTKMPPAQLLRSFLFNYIYKIIYKLY